MEKLQVTWEDGIVLLKWKTDMIVFKTLRDKIEECSNDYCRQTGHEDGLIVEKIMGKHKWTW